MEDWPCKFDEDPLFKRSGYNLSCSQSNHEAIDIHEASGKGQNDFTFPCGPVVPEDDDEVTESKIRAFLDEKVHFFFSWAPINNTLKHVGKVL
jgi:mitogen-activated protein kinase kinase kinase